MQAPNLFYFLQRAGSDTVRTRTFGLSFRRSCGCIASSYWSTKPTRLFTIHASQIEKYKI